MSMEGTEDTGTCSRALLVGMQHETAMVKTAEQYLQRQNTSLSWGQQLLSQVIQETLKS